MDLFIIESVQAPGHYYAGHNSADPADYKLTDIANEAQTFETEEEATLFTEQNLYPGGAAFWGTRPKPR